MSVVDVAPDPGGAYRMRMPHPASYELGYEDGCVAGAIAARSEALRNLVDALRHDDDAYRSWFAGYVRADQLRRLKSCAHVIAAYIEETMMVETFGTTGRATASRP